MPSSATCSPWRARTLVQDGCYLALRIAGWLAVTAACVAACWVLLFVMLGDFSFGGTMLQIDNFAARYGRADAQHQHMLRQFFWTATVGLFVVVGLLRRHSLLSASLAPTITYPETHHG